MTNNQLKQVDNTPLPWITMHSPLVGYGLVHNLTQVTFFFFQKANLRTRRGVDNIFSANYEFLQDINTLASGHTVHGRRAGQLIILCVSSCILLLLWVKWESSRPALAPAKDVGIRYEGRVQEAVFPLFRYYKRPYFPNITADPEWTRFLSSHHRRRRSRSLHALNNNLDNTAQWPLGGGQRQSDLDT